MCSRGVALRDCNADKPKTLNSSFQLIFHYACIPLCNPIYQAVSSWVRGKSLLPEKINNTSADL